MLYQVVDSQDLTGSLQADGLHQSLLLCFPVLSCPLGLDKILYAPSLFVHPDRGHHT